MERSPNEALRADGSSSACAGLKMASRCAACASRVDPVLRSAVFGREHPFARLQMSRGADSPVLQNLRLPFATLATIREAVRAGLGISGDVTNTHVKNVTIWFRHLLSRWKVSVATRTKMQRRTRRCLRNGYVAR